LLDLLAAGGDLGCEPAAVVEQIEQPASGGARLGPECEAGDLLGVPGGPASELAGVGILSILASLPPASAKSRTRPASTTATW